MHEIHHGRYNPLDDSDSPLSRKESPRVGRDKEADEGCQPGQHGSANAPKDVPEEPWVVANQESDVDVSRDERSEPEHLSYGWMDARVVDKVFAGHERHLPENRVSVAPNPDDVSHKHDGLWDVKVARKEAFKGESNDFGDERRVGDGNHGRHECLSPYLVGEDDKGGSKFGRVRGVEEVKLGGTFNHHFDINCQNDGRLEKKKDGGSCWVGKPLLEMLIPIPPSSKHNSGASSGSKPHWFQASRPPTSHQSPCRPALRITARAPQPVFSPGLGTEGTEW